MTPIEIEQRVLELEEIRIVIRAPISEKLGDFDYERKAAGTASVSEWLEQRIRPLLKDYDVVVINGTGMIPHGRQKLQSLRATFDV